MTTDYLKEKYVKSFSYSGEENSHKLPDIELDIDSSQTVSSEDETDGSECDSQNRMRSRLSNEMWSADQIWDELMVSYFNHNIRSVMNMEVKASSRWRTYK